MSFLAYLEDSAFSEWVLLSMLGFPTLIALHSVGMAVAVGLSFMVTLHLNGLFVDLNAGLMPRFLRVAIWGFILNLVTGLALFVSRATDYVGSYIFLIKMLLVVISAIVLFWLKRRLVLAGTTAEVTGRDRMARSMSVFSTVTWFGAVVAGRLIAYLSGLY